MKMWSWRIILLLLFCYACLATDSGLKVWFYSKNFNNTLHWEPVAPAFPGESITYRVGYWSELQNKLHVKEECQNITALSCDLTAETPSKHDVHYGAQVWANGRFHGRTHRFKPIEDTIHGQPNISIYTTETSLYVNATLPLGPNGVSIEHFINEGKSGPSKILATYTLKITHPKWAAQIKEDTTGKFVIKLKNNQTRFCGNVSYKTEWGRKGESEKASFCFELQAPGIYSSLPWIILTAASLVALVIFTVVCTCHYVKGVKPKRIPQALVSNSRVSASVLRSPDNSLVISTINAQTERTFYATVQVKPRAPSVGVGGYSAQDIPSHLWQDNSDSSLGTGALTPIPNLEDTSSQSSEIYSTVGVHVLPVRTNELLSPSEVNRHTGGMTLLHDPGVWDNDATSPLLAPHSLVFQPPNTTGDTQRKLFLSDLIESKTEGPSLASVQTLDDCSDSGCDDSTLSTPTNPYCNSHYFPSQPTVRDGERGRETTSSVVDMGESGYTHNWMPVILFGAAAKESCGYRNSNYHCGWTGRNEEEEGEEEKEKGGEGSLRESLLGGWGLKFQE